MILWELRSLRIFSGVGLGAKISLEEEGYVRVCEYDDGFSEEEQ